MDSTDDTPWNQAVLDNHTQLHQAIGHDITRRRDAHPTMPEAPNCTPETTQRALWRLGKSSCHLPTLLITQDLRLSWGDWLSRPEG
jgi:gamma-glutamyl:cysteine ligase YbdK (ATP-grasp superfamily)